MKIVYDDNHVAHDVSRDEQNLGVNIDINLRCLADRLRALCLREYTENGRHML